MATPTPAQLAQLQRDMDRIKEKVEKFTGERGGEKLPLSAIRRSELYPVGNTNMQSRFAATTTPTKDEFDLLRKDVEQIYILLRKISNFYGTADIPKV